MKLAVYGIDGSSKGEVSVSKAFKGPVRPDLIRKAFIFDRSSQRQPYGADPLAGHRSSAHFHGLRHYRYSMQNREMSRMKRIHNQGYLSYTARVIPGVVKGRKAHPPKAEKVFEKKMNKKEYIKALFSAVSAAADPKLVESRGHRLEKVKVPIVLEDKVQEVKKAKELSGLFTKLGLEMEMEKASKKKASSSKGSTRGRPYKRKKGPLVIIKEDKGILKSCRNLAGFDVVPLSGLTVEMLAPGGQPGRLTIWSKSAIEEIDKKAK